MLNLVNTLLATPKININFIFQWIYTNFLYYYNFRQCKKYVCNSKASLSVLKSE